MLAVPATIAGGCCGRMDVYRRMPESIWPVLPGPLSCCTFRP